ncbi:hypothetical protein PGQ11_010252 [Apiospora arundinis]|uniref:Uncharacterized protein n=1 Tax=Apiospora arundinis TaxID=335852 RepID=A0ABR2I942_9PEZI
MTDEEFAQLLSSAREPGANTSNHDATDSSSFYAQYQSYPGYFGPWENGPHGMGDSITDPAMDLTMYPAMYSAIDPAIDPAVLADPFGYATPNWTAPSLPALDPSEPQACTQPDLGPVHTMLQDVYARLDSIETAAASLQEKLDKLRDGLSSFSDDAFDILRDIHCNVGSERGRMGGVAEEQGNGADKDDFSLASFYDEYLPESVRSDDCFPESLLSDEGDLGNLDSL